MSRNVRYCTMRDRLRFMYFDLNVPYFQKIHRRDYSDLELYTNATGSVTFSHFHTSSLSL